MTAHTPRDLALFVYGRLPDPKPAVSDLECLIHTLFLASVKLEEGRRVACAVCYVNPKKPDPHPPAFVRDPRWKCFPFSSSIDFSVSQLTKIALASDPSVSALCVYPDKKGTLKIWGMVDQQGGFQALLNHEGSGWSPPGIIQVQIVAPGHVVVSSQRHLLGELSGDVLTEDPTDLFVRKSVVYKKWSRGIDTRIWNIRKKIEEEGYSSTDLDVDAVWDSWTTVIRRVLLRTKSFGQGGAFLVTDRVIEDGLTVKYPLLYDRLPALFEKVVAHSYVSGKAYDKIYDCLEEDDVDTIEVGKYLEESVAESDTEDAANALTGSIAFVASLSRVDGAVLLDTDFTVYGFGCELLCTPSTDRAFFTNRTIPKKAGARIFDPAQFGTRHRSMIRYCSNDKAAIGFVISHDGPVRAFTSVGDNLFAWDNARLTDTETGPVVDQSH